MKSLKNSRYNTQPYMIEKIIASLTYLTMGMAGFVWLIVCAFAKSGLRPFLRYHIFQSFFLVMGLFLLNIFTNLVVNILSVIPIINVLVYKILFFFTAPILFGYSIVNIFILVVMLYLVLTSIRGKYSYIPWVSNIIDSNVGRN